MAEQSPIPQEQSSEARKLSYLPTTEAYERWAEVYDSDSNPLQAIDDVELKGLLPKFLDLVEPSENDGTIRIIDLGCGTGRNTRKLLSTPNADITGLDASGNMLDIARTSCEEVLSTLPSDQRASIIRFSVFDVFVDSRESLGIAAADGIISTLVIEHIPTKEFFSGASSLLRPGGYLLLTNMHSDMGQKSQAGFKDPSTGEKVRPVSYAHRVEDVLKSAEEHGLQVVGEVVATAVTGENVSLLGSRAKKWLGVNMWFGMIFQKSITPTRR